MSFRIDVDGKSRYNADGSKVPFGSAQQQQLFVQQINQAIQERARSGDAFDPTREKIVVAQPGDSLWQIAEQNNVKFVDVLGANAELVDRQSGQIDVNDVVIVPHAEPELVADDPRNEKNVPLGETMFRSELYERANKIQYADDPAKVDYDAETKVLQGDVGTYLDSLPAADRQAAISRLIGSKDHWQDASPALTAMEAAAKERGLIADPEEAFAQHLYDKGNKLNNADSSADHAGGAKALSQSVDEYLQGLPEGKRGEALQALYDRDWEEAGPSQIALEETAEKLGITLRESTHRGPDVENSARRIIETANATGKPDEAYKSLSTAYESAPADIQAALLEHGEARTIIGNAADWATTRLKNYDPETAVSEQGDSAEAMRNLELLTRHSDPKLSAQLMSDAMPVIEAANAKRQEKIGGELLGREGQQNLNIIMGRIGQTPSGSAIIDRFTNMHIGNPESMRLAIVTGAGLDYPLATASKVPDGKYVENTILPSVAEFSAVSVNGAVDKYSTHMQELQWLITNHGSAMTPEQLEKAITDYEKEKGQGWVDDKLKLEGEVAEKGNQLLNQISQLSKLPPELASQQKAANEAINKIFSDDKSVMAMQIALKQDPALLDKPAVMSLLTHQARLTDRGRKLAEEAMTQIVRRDVLPTFGNLDPNNPASIAEAKAGIEKLRNSQAANLLGIPDEEFKKALAAVEEALPAAGESEAQMVQKLKDLDAKLTDTNGGMKAFRNNTVPGQVLRLIGLAGVGAGLASTISRTGEDPLLKYKVLIDAAGVGQRSIELLHGFKQINPDSLAVKHFGSSSTTAAKWLGSVGASFDLVLATRSYMSGDWQMGTLQAAAGAGGILAAFGTGSMAGPVGLVIVGAAVIGQMVLLDTRESNKYMTDTSAHFLEHAELSDRTAAALVDQSGDGYSPVPLLIKYAQMKGYKLDDPADQRRFADWLDSIPADKLGTLRDNLHHTLDDRKGDIADFPATSDGDDKYTDNEQLHERPVVTKGKATITSPSLADRIKDGDAKPESVAQIDVILDELGIATA
ncbi:peptidoglycan-binding protein LysM [Phyllobacterium sp. 21LDTY02-6]|uniref:peptidoglycan-binding protein LysM n=1 Tax=Phyllobacterium sp. 21LDTY02-6 TaxID=2944903 RepID=UPI0020206725|nr:peptidoglycan-binding protein LysM [Phyllobacterium sp. 21LDTY02-6]MCO4318264.1 peptidoglycan-binding protein LysM [Phyllobacterium sp. 21LDTY02-6]